jgi:hypothetical protein
MKSEVTKVERFTDIADALTAFKQAGADYMRSVLLQASMPPRSVNLASKSEHGSVDSDQLIQKTGEGRCWGLASQE